MKGKVIKYPQENINTDLIIPARYLVDINPQFLAEHCMEDLDMKFHQNKNNLQATILVSGSNFGSGSSREQAPIALKASGIELIIAPSFARIFFRNAINIGLPILQFSDIDALNSGDLLDIDFGKGIIENITTSKSYSFSKFPTFLQKIIKVQGLINFAREQIANSEEGSL
ncbi:MAG: 3-isopropylmalate dehydratase small subunit [Candidatus Odinarchaeota archaeon]